VSGCIDCCCLLTPPLSPLLSPIHPRRPLLSPRPVLNDEGVVEAIDAADTDDPNAHPLIREAVDGAVLAVDISEWIFQATVGLCYWGCVGAVTS
jgi:hypothetical protein